jgi:hypothetical protein
MRVEEFVAVWMPSEKKSTNYYAFIQELDAGKSPEVAAKNTFSGKCVAEYGLTNVGDQVFKETAKTIPHYDIFTPTFTRPDFGGGAKYQNYAEAWVDAMGRSKRELVPRVAPEPQVKPAVDIIGRLSAYLQENFTQEAGAKVMDAVSNTLKVSIKSSDVTR